VSALAVIVQGARDQFLAGTALAHDHHGQIGLRKPRDDAVDLLHRRGTTNQRQALGALFYRNRFAFDLWTGERALDDGGQFLQIERFGQIVESTAFGGRDRGQDRVLRAHHDDGQIGAQTLDAWDEVETVFVGQDHVGDDEIAVAGRYPAPQTRRGARRADVIPGAPQSLVQHRADCRIVVGDKDHAVRHRSLPRCR